MFAYFANICEASLKFSKPNKSFITIFQFIISLASLTATVPMSAGSAGGPRARTAPAEKQRRKQRASRAWKKRRTTVGGTAL